MFGFPIRYEEPFFRPPAEANSFLLQATVGCSHNLCTYCAMYRAKTFRVRRFDEVAEEIKRAGAFFRKKGIIPRKAFLGDGDALAAPMDYLKAVLSELKQQMPTISRVSTYVTAQNVLDKTERELQGLSVNGLSLGYLGLESGSDDVLKLIVKGNTAADMLACSDKLYRSGWKLSVIAMLGIGGTKLSGVHAAETSSLTSAMAPHFLSFLTTVVIPGTPYERVVTAGKIQPLSCRELMLEAQQIIEQLEPTQRRVIFRANHVSNLVPLEGILPRDKAVLCHTLKTWADECPVELYPEHDPRFL